MHTQGRGDGCVRAVPESCSHSSDRVFIVALSGVSFMSPHSITGLREPEYFSLNQSFMAFACAILAASPMWSRCADAKMQTLTEIFKDKNTYDWLGYNRLFETNLRKTIGMGT